EVCLRSRGARCGRGGRRHDGERCKRPVGARRERSAVGFGSALKGAPAPTDSVGFRVYLGWRDQAGAEAPARAVSDPSSSSYGKYLSPGQFQSQFAPAQGDVNAVKDWLSAQGFDVQYVPANNHYVSAEGTVVQIESAFATKLNLYSVQGQTLTA